MGELLTPELVAELGSLEVKAKTIVDSVASGQHRGRRRGFSADFLEHRDYTAGDDVRYIDWKIVGRRDRYYVRQYEDETRLQAWVLVDASPSMKYCSDDQPLTKIEYTACLAAALSWLIVQQGDEIGLACWGDGIEPVLPPSGDQTRIGRVLAELESASERCLQSTTGDAEQSTAWQQWRTLDALVLRIPKRSVVILLTDCFGETDRLHRVLKHFHHRKCDVRLLQILDPAERVFPFDDALNFLDLETGHQQYLSAGAIQLAYLEEMSSFLSDIKRVARECACDYHLVQTDEPLNHALRRVIV